MITKLRSIVILLFFYNIATRKKKECNTKKKIVTAVKQKNANCKLQICNKNVNGMF